MRNTLVVALVLLAPGAALAQDKPNVTWRRASPGNYSQTTRSRISQIVIHKAEGSNASGWFQDARAKASAHYDVHADGSAYQSVDDRNVAWHAGNSSVNAASIGIEHSGFTAKNDVTEAEYRTSAQLSAYLCKTYSITIDRSSIIGHAEVGGNGGANRHTDPGSYWDWNKYVNLIRNFSGQGSTPDAGQQTTTPGQQTTAGQQTTPGSSTAGTTPGSSTGSSTGSGTSTGSGQQTSGQQGTNQQAKILRRGSTGAEVKSLQQKLKDVNCDPGPIDGIFGPLTEAAVKKFQGQVSLPVTGVVDVPTWVALGKKDGTGAGGFDVSKLAQVLPIGQQIVQGLGQTSSSSTAASTISGLPPTNQGTTGTTGTSTTGGSATTGTNGLQRVSQVLQTVTQVVGALTQLK
jgi:N-acetyl-anhydromuramyl-L-alanine amidase AmpD/peptidoglycan hydrolase-like protein with peptidoglycan-binding domain